MDRDIVLRGLKRSDYPRVRELLWATWFEREYGKSSILRYFMRQYYLMSYLVKSNYRMAAVSDGRVIGFILSRSDSDFSKYRVLSELIQMKLCRFFVSLNKDGRRYLGEWQKFYDAYAVLNEHTEKAQKAGRLNPDCEYLLTAVDPLYRGKGLGYTMLCDCIRAFKAKGCRCCTYFTDSTCSTGFYKKHGYEFDDYVSVYFDDEYPEVHVIKAHFDLNDPKFQN